MNPCLLVHTLRSPHNLVAPVVPGASDEAKAAEPVSPAPAPASPAPVSLASPTRMGGMAMAMPGFGGGGKRHSLRIADASEFLTQSSEPSPLHPSLLQSLINAFPFVWVAWPTLIEQLCTGSPHSRGRAGSEAEEAQRGRHSGHFARGCARGRCFRF